MGGIKCTAMMSYSDVPISMSISIVLEFEPNIYVEGAFISGGWGGGWSRRCFRLPLG